MSDGEKDVAIVFSFLALTMGGTILVLAIIAYPWLIAGILMLIIGSLLVWAALDDEATEDDLSEDYYRGRRINE